MSDYGSVQIGAHTFEKLEECGEWDYDWTIGYLMRRDDGALYWGVTSGCSCNDFDENIDESELVSVANWQAAVEEAKATFSDNDVAEFASRLMKV